MNRYIRNIRERLHIIVNNRYLSASERLRLIAHLRVTVDHMRIPLLRRLIIDETRGDHFQIGETSIFFRPDYEIKDADFLMEGIIQVIIETWLKPQFFHKAVNLRKGDICLDLGANIGTTSILFSGIVGEKGRVYAFEPVTHELLTKNISENHIKNVQVVPRGISHYVGKSEIEIGDFCLDSSMARRDYTKGYYSHCREIEVTSLDAVVKELSIPRVDFIKVDIEGLEEWAILGAERLIKEHSPKWSISSYHVDFNNEPQHPKLVSLLKKFGYQIHEIPQAHIFAWIPR
jgi:FkbM family methyltransferase